MRRRPLKNATATEPTPMRLDDLSACQSAIMGENTFLILVLLHPFGLFVGDVELERLVGAVGIRGYFLIDQFLVLGHDMPRAN